jgi:hypothetical protein
VTRSRVLMTGAMGRVAAPLIPALADRYDVRLLDSTEGDGDAAGAPLMVGELADPEVLETALDGVHAVVHLAGNPHPDAPWHDLEEPNVEAFVALLRAARGHGVRRVVFASSVHAMGFYEGSRRWPIDPAWPPAPCCAYGATKAFDEALARVYAYQSGMSAIGLRLGLCAPEAGAAEAVAGWLGPEDLRRIVLGALTADVEFGVYHAVSWPSRQRWNIDTAMRDLGYEPDRDVGPDGDAQTGEGHLCTCGPGHAPA